MLRVDDLEVRYGSIAALQGVSVSVDEGEIVGIVGPNGAGKSSLLLSISGAVRPDAGRIEFAGEGMKDLAPEQVVRKGVALVPEGREIFGELTVEENLILGATIRNDRRGVRDDLQAQMVAFPILARALMGRPRLLLLDEPSLGLAPLITAQVYDTLVSLNKAGMTILVVEQNPARIMRVAQRVYVMRSGVVANSGPPGILNRGEELDEAYFGYDAHNKTEHAKDAP